MGVSGPMPDRSVNMATIPETEQLLPSPFKAKRGFLWEFCFISDQDTPLQKNDYMPLKPLHRR